VNQDFRDLIAAFNAAKVEYLVHPDKLAAGRLQDLADVERLTLGEE
jgi:hypothetical protein